MNYQKVLDYWFKELSPEQWFFDTTLDASIKERFEKYYWAIVAGETVAWRTNKDGALAEVIVLDQFARNIFRDEAQSFIYDPLALALAQQAIAQGFDQKMTQDEKRFLYMPFMHSESLMVQAKSIELFEQLGDLQTLDYARKHHDVIKQFGRFPGENKVLGRTDTEEERIYNESGSPF